MNIVEVLKDARKLCKTHWAKGRGFMAPTFPQVCVVTSIRRVMKNDDNPVGPYTRVFKVANGIPIPSSLSLWNDSPERTLDDVLKGFDKAISYCESHPTI